MQETAWSPPRLIDLDDRRYSSSCRLKWQPDDGQAPRWQSRCAPRDPVIGGAVCIPRWHSLWRMTISTAMCGRVIQSSGPLRYAIVDGMNVRDSRMHNYPPRWNGAPSQDLL